MEAAERMNFRIGLPLCKGAVWSWQDVNGKPEWAHGSLLTKCQNAEVPAAKKCWIPVSHVVHPVTEPLRAWHAARHAAQPAAGRGYPHLYTARDNLREALRKALCRAAGW